MPLLLNVELRHFYSFPDAFLSLFTMRGSCYLSEMSERLSEEYKYISPLSGIKYVRVGSNADSFVQ